MARAWRRRPQPAGGVVPAVLALALAAPAAAQPWPGAAREPLPNAAPAAAAPAAAAPAAAAPSAAAPAAAAPPAAAPSAAAPAAAAPAAVSQPAPCHLHVWPAGRVRSVTQGDVFNHQVDAALRPHEDSPGWPTAALTPEAQRAALAALPLARLLGMEGAAVVIHAAPVPAFQARTAPGRLAGAGADCVIELVVLDIALEAAPLAGRSLRVALLRRDFPADAAGPSRRFQAFVGQAITTLPKPGEAPIAPVEAVDAELAAAFRLTVEEFARLDAAARKGRPMAKGGR
jgi:hypothetical protein